MDEFTNMPFASSSGRPQVELVDDPLPINRSVRAIAGLEHAPLPQHAGDAANSSEADTAVQALDQSADDQDQEISWFWCDKSWGILLQTLSVTSVPILFVYEVVALILLLRLLPYFIQGGLPTNVVPTAMTYVPQYLFGPCVLTVYSVIPMMFLKWKARREVSQTWGYRIHCLVMFVFTCFWLWWRFLRDPIPGESTDDKISDIGDKVVDVIQEFWSTGRMPRVPESCETRVAPQQATLFTSAVYKTQFARTYQTVTNVSWKYEEDGIEYSWQLRPTFDLELSRSIRDNVTLCDQGFIGNTDLYGLGIRCGVYLQWISSLLANNFLSSGGQEIQKVYLISSLAICLATMITSSTKSCVFGIEIEVLYIIYWGGYVCVFASAPCSVRLGNAAKWMKLDWTAFVLFATHWAMVYHGLWFIWNGYDQVFARMPCGTYPFFLAPVLDPGESFWILRDLLTLLSIPWFPLLLTVFPLVAALLVPEAAHTVQRSSLFRAVFPRKAIWTRGRVAHTNNFAHDDETGVVEGTGEPKLAQRLYAKAEQFQSNFRKTCGLPGERREGIRLVTPADVEHRRFLRIRWAIMGLLACILSIVGIELMLIWNRVGEVYSVEATGQYVSLIIGVATFISVLWSLIQQEGDRRRSLIHRQTTGERDSYELQSLRSAIGHAFAQPDVEFSEDGGALPGPPSTIEDDVADTRLSALSQV